MFSFSTENPTADSPEHYDASANGSSRNQLFQRKQPFADVLQNKFS